MPIKMATWLSGNAAQPEFTPFSQRRMAGSGLFGGTDTSQNWFHFPITTPVIIDDKRPKLTKFFVLYRMKFSTVMRIHLWSGNEKIWDWYVNTSGLPTIRDRSDVDRKEFVENETMFSLNSDFAGGHPEPLEIRQGLSISVKVQFDSRVHVNLPAPIPDQDMARNIGTIEFYSVGADWELA